VRSRGKLQQMRTIFQTGVEKLFSHLFPSFPRRRESGIVRLLLNPRFQEDDELDCKRVLFQHAVKDRRRACFSPRTPCLRVKYAFRIFLSRHEQTEDVKYHKPLSDFNMILFYAGDRDEHLRECVKKTHRGGQGGVEGKTVAVYADASCLVRCMGLLDKNLIEFILS